MSSVFYDSPIGVLLIREENSLITHVSFTNRTKGSIETSSQCLISCMAELDLYFNRQLMQFTVPVCLKGSDFRVNCWQALMAIPYGQTVSYRQQAEAIGRPRAYRAVGGANHHNPIAIIVPCHRVIGADGGLTGYGGGIEIKKYLLDLERETLSNLGNIL